MPDKPKVDRPKPRKPMPKPGIRQMPAPIKEGRGSSWLRSLLPKLPSKGKKR